MKHNDGIKLSPDRPVKPQRVTHNTVRGLRRPKRIGIQDKWVELKCLSWTICWDDSQLYTNDRPFSPIAFTLNVANNSLGTSHVVSAALLFLFEEYPKLHSILAIHPTPISNSLYYFYMQRKMKLNLISLFQHDARLRFNAVQVITSVSR